MRVKVWINIIASCLSYELGVHGEKKFNGKSGILWKMDTFHSTSKTESFQRVIFVVKVLPWNLLKWRGKSVLKSVVVILHIL